MAGTIGGYGITVTKKIGNAVVRNRMKRRLREGAKLIVLDPREIDLVRSPHVQADYHLQLGPGTNVALITSLAHVIVTEGLLANDYIAEHGSHSWELDALDPELLLEPGAALATSSSARVRRRTASVSSAAVSTVAGSSASVLSFRETRTSPSAASTLMSL